MYNKITGVFTGFVSQGPQTFVLLEQAGLEWMIEASRSTLGHLPQRGQPLSLYVWLNHTEDTMSLFGFSSQEERQVFHELLKVQGIGPRAAIKILSGTTPQNLVKLLETEDLAGLEKIPGLGKKTSQKVLLTLRGKLVLDDTGSKEELLGPDNDIVQALVAMGFEKKSAAREVAKIAPTLEGKTTMDREQELLRLAIIALSQG